MPDVGASDLRGSFHKGAPKRWRRKASTATALTAYVLSTVMAMPAVSGGISTLITPGSALGPVSLGMSEKQVTAILGSSERTQSGALTFPRWAMTVDFRKGNAIRIGTLSPLFRTIQDLRVGVSHARATQLIGDQNEVLDAAGTYLTVLYPFEGVGLVFRDDRAVEIFIQPPLHVHPSIARILPLDPAPSQPVQSGNKAAVSDSATGSGGGGADTGGSGGGGGGAGSSSGGGTTGGANATGNPAAGNPVSATNGSTTSSGGASNGSGAGASPGPSTPLAGTDDTAVAFAGAPSSFGAELAVNGGTLSVAAPLNGAKRLFEPGPVASSGGTITDSFAPMGVHVYVSGP